MWRTVIVNQGEKITLKDNWLVVYNDGMEQRVPIDDLYSVVIDNRASLMSVAVLTTLAKADVHIFFCDEKHVPVSVNIPVNTHYKTYGMIKKQLAVSDELRAKLWQKIVMSKIDNQAECLRLAGVVKEKVDKVKELVELVNVGDTKNREGTAARRYFPALFGSYFRRSGDDITNAALNYGYTIVRSAVCKTLVAHGFNCVLGLHHINENDAFNLAEDMMEPFRPLVDLYVDANCDNLVDELTRSNRKTLINTVNLPVIFDGKKMRVRYAIDRMVVSLMKAIEENDAEYLKLPTLIYPDELFEDEMDG